MILESVNVGRPRDVRFGDRTQRTAIYKKPVLGPVRVGQNGLVGDDVGNTHHHGGPDQAVYAYFTPDYQHWETRLGRALAPGTFGENLTVSHACSCDLWVGDRLSIGATVLEVTAPRIPCGTFAMRMGLTGAFPDEFRLERRPGVYLRVIEPGVVSAGDRVGLHPGQRSVSIVEMLELWGTSPDLPTLDRLLEAPIAERAAADYLRKRRRLVTRGVEDS